MLRRWLGYQSYGTSMLCILLCLMAASAANAQTTAFTYQGKLTDSGNPANGQYDLQFKLFDALSGGTQQGTTQTVSNVTVAGGIFTVNLDFGACATCFNGAARFLEIAVKPTSGGSFATLAPRQPVTSTPYAINAAQLGGLAASGYLQNSTSQQASSNFNISGNGTAGGTFSGSIVNATTQYNLGGTRILSAAGTNNLFAGVNTGAANTTGSNNAFFGTQAGQQNTTGTLNTFFGYQAGNLNTTGNQNTFYGAQAGLSNSGGSQNAIFGSQAGFANSSGQDNAFFGWAAGRFNTTGNHNAFFGSQAGQLTTTASNNAFFGYQAGQQNSTGTDNAFFGSQAGISNTTGFSNAFFGAYAGQMTTTASNNAFFGTSAGFVNSTGSNNSFFGAFAGDNTTSSNNAFFGSNAGLFNSTGDTNSFFGSQAGVSNTTGTDNAFFGYQAGGSNTTGNFNAFFGWKAGFSNNNGVGNTFIGEFADFIGTNITGNDNTLLGSSALVASNLTNATAIGANAAVTQSNSLVLGDIGVSVGIGTTAPVTRLDVRGTLTLDNGADAGLFTGTGNAELNRYLTLLNSPNSPSASGLKAGGILVSDSYAFANPGKNDIVVKGNAYKTGGGSWLAFSDERLKHIKGRFTPGLQTIMRLQPIRYEYKPDNALGITADGEHIGFGAQAVQKILPEAVSANDKGYLLVNNDPIVWAMLNAVKEQQQQIIQQQRQIKQQQEEMAAIKKLLCRSQPRAALCRAKSLK